MSEFINEIPALSNVQNVEMLRRQLAEAEAIEAAHRQEVEAKEAARIAGLRTVPSVENHHERIGFLEDHKEEEKFRLDRHERWLEAISVRLFGIEHGLDKTYGEHAVSALYDSKHPSEAADRDRKVVSSKY